MVTKLWFLAFITAFISTVHCDVVPTLDLDSLGGELGFIGDYAGLSPFKSYSQFESLPNTNAHAIVMSTPIDDKLIYQLFATVNGSIEAYCQLSDKQYILAGNFDTINGTTYNHITQLDITTNQLSPLQQGLDGPVRSLYCTNNAVYVGGDFIAPKVENVTAYTGHVALWQNNQWSPVPWKGFNGPVYSIIPHTQQQSILFGGRFDSTGDGKFASLSTSQSINLASSAIISGGNSALSGNNSDPANIICSKSPWLLQDGVPGYWEAQFGSSNSPSVFRISNTRLAERGTNEFNIIALGSNQYFDLSYKDPVTNTLVTCSDKCFLSNDSSIPYQDFTVTNNLTANALRININSWYGAGGGLGGVDIFTSDVSLQPHISKNTAASSGGCSSSSSSTATVTGNWTEVYSYQTYQNFLIANLPSNQLQSATDLSVTYQPFIPVQEVYNVYVTTPGCIGTSTCNQRTQVALDVSMMPGNTSTIVIDQKNTADNRSLIYTGPISASSDSFQPTIILRVAPDATIPSSSTVSIVADSIEFIRNTTSAKLSGILNYYTSNNTWVPLSQQLPVNATVRTLQSNENRVFIGGEFAVNGSYSNVVAYDFNQQAYQPLGNAGLNGNVATSVLVGSQLVLGGRFTNTAVPQTSTNLNNVAIYDVQANAWSAMNNGVNDGVDYIFTTSDNTVHLSGAFSSADGIPAFNNAEWNLSKRSWVPSSSLINGPVSNQISLNTNTALYMGSIKSAQTYRANHIASLASNNKEQQWQSQITTADPNAAVTSGVVWKNQNTPVVILGGLFNFNNTQYHVAYQNGDGVWTGLLKNIQGEVKTMYVLQNLLFIGGQFNGTLDDSTSQATSFVVYDFIKQAFQEVQGLLTSDQKPGQVNVIRPQADGKNIFVAGNFSFAGLLNCNSICELASDSRQWTQLNQDIGGNIKDIAIRNNVVTVIGDLKVGSTSSGMAVLENLDSTTASWKPVSNMNLSHILNDNTGHYLVSGVSDNNQPYLGSWDGNTLKAMDTATTKLGPASDIRQVTYVPVSSSPSNARYPADSDQVLLAVGHLNLPNFGSCSAALFDGEAWYPYLLTSSINGTNGSIQSAFTTTPCCTFNKVRGHLSVPAVILVSIAISLGIIFLCIALSFIIILFKRRGKNQKLNADPMQEWKPKYRPHSLLAMLDAAHLGDSAIFTTGVAGAGAGAAAAAAGASRDEKDQTTGYTTALDTRGGGHSMDLSDNNTVASRLRSSSGFSEGGEGLMIPFSVMMANALKSDNENSAASEETPKVYYAKFPFEAKEFGELAFEAHAPIVVTDTSDNVWWMGYKDDGSNHPVSGLFPSNYVSRAKPF